MEGLDRLTGLWLVPLALALAVWALGRMRVPMVVLRTLAFVGMSAVAAVAGAVFAEFDPTTTGFQFVRAVPLMSALGVHYHVGVDGISLGLVTALCFLLPWLVLAGTAKGDASPRALAATLVVAGSWLGALLSLNLVPFLLFSELATLALAFLLGTAGGPGRVEAASRFYLASVTGSLLVWAVWGVVATLHGAQTESVSFDWIAQPGSAAVALIDTAVPRSGEWWANQATLFAALTLGLALRAPFAPFHGWLRPVGRAASTTGAVLLASGGMPLALYAFVRFALPLFPGAALEFGPWLATFAAVTVGYGAWVAVAQRDLRATALALVTAQGMLILLGMLLVSVQSWNGSLLHLANHALASAALLLAVGMLEERRGTRFLGAFGGVARPMPVFAFFFGLACLAATGMPLLAGFVGEVLILVGAFFAQPGTGALGLLGVTSLAVVALLTLRRVLLGPVEREANLSLIDLGWRERWILFALLVPIVAIGVWPSPWLRRIEPAVIDGVEHVERARPPEVALELSQEPSE